MRYDVASVPELTVGFSSSLHLAAIIFQKTSRGKVSAISVTERTGEKAGKQESSIDS